MIYWFDKVCPLESWKFLWLSHRWLCTTTVASPAGFAWTGSTCSAALSATASPQVLTACHILRFGHFLRLRNLGYLSILADHVDRLNLLTSLDWFGLPIVDPPLLSVELGNQIVNVLDLSLILCPSQMRICGYMLIKVIILDIAYLAVSMVDLRPRNRNIAHWLPEDSFHLRALFDLCDLLTLVLMLLNIVKPFDAVDSLIKSLARVHALRAISDQLMNIISSTCRLDKWTISERSGIGRNWIKLMVNLFVTL